MRGDLKKLDQEEAFVPAGLAPVRGLWSPVDPNASVKAKLTQVVEWREPVWSGRQSRGFATDWFPTRNATNDTAFVETSLAAALVERIAQVGAAIGVRESTAFLAALFVLLQRTTGQTSLLIGTPAAPRARSDAKPSDDGPRNMQPVEVQTDGIESFVSLLAKVNAEITEPSAGSSVRLEQGNTIFDVFFDYTMAPPLEAAVRGLSVDRTAIELSTSPHGLNVVLRPANNGRLSCSFDYNADVYDCATIEYLVAHFEVLLESIAEDATLSIARLKLATRWELGTIVDVWSRPDRSRLMLPPGGNAETLHELVAFNARHRPDAIALIEDGVEPISYAELDRRANCLAHALRARGVKRDVRVGLYLERSVTAVIAMLATLKAGGAYVPLDPEYPPARIEYMIAKANVELIVTSRESFAALARYAPLLIDIDDAGHAGNNAQQPLSTINDPDSLAYVIFTSGSTGQPKAVAISHRAVVALVTHTPLLACVPSDTALLNGTMAFDASVPMIWSPLVYGARLAVMPAGPFSLAEFEAQLIEHNVTVVLLPTALFHQLVEERLGALRGLRTCIVGGDVLSPLHSARFARTFRDCKLINGYGPTEATVATSLYEVLPDTHTRRSTPIGRPCADSRIYILDAWMQPVAVGLPGELWIGGRGLAREYLNDAALTAQRFVRDSFSADPTARLYRSGDHARWLPDGQIDFLGRADNQVKIRGFRIEPTEIEFALLEHPGVRHAVVVVRGDSMAERRLVAYAEVRDPELTGTELRLFLKSKLPPHAIPAQFVLLEEMAKTPSGKLDRTNLPEPAALERTTVAVAAKDELERRLVALWETLLGVHPIGIQDDFFALGGHSLQAIRLIGEIERQFGTRIPSAVLFAKPTIDNLASALRRDPATLGSLQVVAFNKTGRSTPLFFLHGILAPGGGAYCLELARYLGADRPLFVMGPQGVDGEGIASTVEAIARENIVALKSVIPNGPYLLGGFSIAGLIVFEMARQLVADGERVEDVIVIDGPHAGPWVRPVVEIAERFGRAIRVAPARIASLTSTLSRIAYHLADFSANPDKGKFLRLTVSKIKTALNRSQLQDRAEALEQPRLDGLLHAWGWLSGGYVPRRYWGHLTLLISAEEPHRDVAVAGWLSTAPRTNVRAIPGNHLGAVSEHIMLTAKAIADAL